MTVVTGVRVVTGDRVVENGFVRVEGDRIAEVMRKHGHRSVNAAALRNRWIIDLAERAPACLLLALGDVVDVQVLADQRELLRTFTLEEAITLLKETHL